MHDVALLTPAYCPTMQLLQSFAIDPTSSINVPGGQYMHCTTPLNEDTNPLGQFWQI